MVVVMAAAVVGTMSLPCSSENCRRQQDQVRNKIFPFFFLACLDWSPVLFRFCSSVWFSVLSVVVRLCLFTQGSPSRLGGQAANGAPNLSASECVRAPWVPRELHDT